MDQDVTWHGGRPRPRPHCARWGSSPLPKKGAQHLPSIRGPCLLWPTGGLGGMVGLSPGNFVLDTDQAPPPRAQPPPKKKSAHVCCGQTAGWIKVPLGTKVGLGSGHILLHGDPAPPKRGTAPNFRPMSIVAKRSPMSATAELSSAMMSDQ